MCWLKQSWHIQPCYSRVTILCDLWPYLPNQHLNHSSTQATTLFLAQSEWKANARLYLRRCYTVSLDCSFSLRRGTTDAEINPFTAAAQACTVHYNIYYAEVYNSKSRKSLESKYFYFYFYSMKLLITMKLLIIIIIIRNHMYLFSLLLLWYLTTTEGTGIAQYWKFIFYTYRLDYRIKKRFVRLCTF